MLFLNIYVEINIYPPLMRKIYKVNYTIYIRMAVKTKIREITVVDDGGTFNTFFKKFLGEKAEYDFEGIGALRKLLSNEKARVLHIIKTKNPDSIYRLAKILERDFKSVNDDIKLLERFGFVDLISEKSGKRERLRPVIVVDSLVIKINI